MARVIGLLAVVFAVICLVGADATNNSTVVVTRPRVCFDTVLTSTTDSVIAHQLQYQVCTLWKLDKRHSFGAQFSDDNLQISMIVTYPYTASIGSSSSRAPVYLVETYTVASGALLSSVVLKQASLPALDSKLPIAVCITSTDVYISVYGNGSNVAMQHFDRKSGEQRPTKQYEQITNSDRVWMTCTNSAVYMSVPAANAVWRLSPTDGLLERIVARLQSPTALSIDNGLLRVVSGRPAMLIHSYQLDKGTHRGAVDISSRAHDTERGYLPLRGISVASTAPFVAAVISDDDTLSQVTDPRVSVVFINQRQLAIHYADSLLSDGRSVMVDGLPMSYTTAVPITAVANSELLNAGNSDKLANILFTSDDRRLITIDIQGSVNMFSSFDHQCPTVFTQRLPPLLTAESSLIYTDERDSLTPLLYVAADETTLVLRPTANSPEEYVWPEFCPDAGETISSGVSTSWPRPVVCALCGAEIVCIFSEGMRRAYPLPINMLPSLASVRLTWDETHRDIVLFHAPSDIWKLTIDGGDGMDTAGWIHVARFDDLPTVLDINYWDAREVYAGVYALRISANYLLMVGAESANWTILGATDMDKTQTAGNKFMLLVPNVLTTGFNSESICVGFPLNQTTRPGMSADQRRETTIGMFVGGIGAVVCALLCAILIIGAAFYRAEFVLPWREKPETSFAPLADTESNYNKDPELSEGRQLSAWERMRRSLGLEPKKSEFRLEEDFCNLSDGNTAPKASDPDPGHMMDVELQPIASAPVSQAAAAAAVPSGSSGRNSPSPLALVSSSTVNPFAT